MNISSRILVITLSTLLLLAPGAGMAQEPQAIAIIEELGLTEAGEPMAKNPRWSPQRVAVTLPGRISAVVPDYEARLKAAAGDVELVFDRSGSFVMSGDILKDVDAIIGLCTPPTMQGASTDLLWLHNYSVGMDRCTGLSEQQKNGIVFTNNKRLSGPTIAEHTIAMLMAIARGLPTYTAAQAQRRWDDSPFGEQRFGEIKGKTLLVVGLGGIGTEIAWRAHGLGMRVIATRNSSRSGPDYVEYVGLADELHTLAGQADVVVNALPLTADTTGIFDKSFFDSVKPGAIFLSVGRGQSTVTADLVAALESGQLYGAGLDVTDPEPLPEDSPLWLLPRVIITPHVSTAGADSVRRMTTIAVENLRRYVAGEPLLNIVDIRRGY